MTIAALPRVDTVGRVADLYTDELKDFVCGYLHAANDRYGRDVVNRLLARLMVAVHAELGHDLDLDGLVAELEGLR